jgi:hypothetical protein
MVDVLSYGWTECDRRPFLPLGHEQSQWCLPRSNGVFTKILGGRSVSAVNRTVEAAIPLMAATCTTAVPDSRFSASTSDKIRTFDLSGPATSRKIIGSLKNAADDRMEKSQIPRIDRCLRCSIFS